MCQFCLKLQRIPVTPLAKSYVTRVENMNDTCRNRTDETYGHLKSNRGNSEARKMVEVLKKAIEAIKLVPVYVRVIQLDPPCIALIPPSSGVCYAVTAAYLQYFCDHAFVNAYFPCAIDQHLALVKQNILNPTFHLFQ